jgi:hypothetical protein
MNPVDILVYDIQANLIINLDMFTVSTPGQFYVARCNNVPQFNQYSDTVNIQRAYRTEVNYDLYVSPSGNDINTGLSPAQAMKSITKAVHRIAADSLNVKTVHVLPGTYSEGSDDQILPIPLKSNVNIIGTENHSITLTSNILSTTQMTLFWAGYMNRNVKVSGFITTSDLDIGNYPVHMGGITQNVTFYNMLFQDMIVYKDGAVYLNIWESSSLDSLIVRNIITPESVFQINEVHSSSIHNSIIENIHSTYSSPDTPGDDSWGGAVVNIWVVDSLSVDNCTFRNISVLNNQPIFHITHRYSHLPLEYPDVSINNCLFENIRTNDIRAIGFSSNRFGEYKVSNCTFYNNYGQAAAVGISGRVDMRNNIFFNPDASNEIYMHSAIPDLDRIGILDFDYNNISGGISRISNPDPRNTLIYGEHNLSSDPIFASTTVGHPEYLRLANGSPCINSGTPDTLGLELLPFDLAGNFRIWDGRIDMGCYEHGSEAWVANDDPFVPELPGIITATNYPNPFNPTTTIAFSLPVAGRTTLEIYNFKGQRIRTLIDDYFPSGKHTAVWDGKADGGSSVSSGIYFYRIASGKHNFTGKMILAK